MAKSRTDRGALFRSDLSILAVAVVWGSTFVVMQVVGESVPPAALLALRFLIALPPVLLLAAPSLRGLTRGEVLTGAAFGVMLYGILMLETIGVRHTSAASAGFLITVSVVLVPLLERVVNRRSQPGTVYAATVVALLGAALLLLRDGLHPRSGDLIILAAAMVRAGQLTLSGRHTHGRSPQNLTAVQFVVVATLATLTSVLTGRPVWSVAAGVDGGSWLLIAYLGVLGTAFAFFAQLRAARLSGPTRVGLILCTEPVFATAFAVAVGGESLGPLQVIGGLLMACAALAGRTAPGGSAPGGSASEGGGAPLSSEGGAAPLASGEGDAPVLSGAGPGRGPAGRG